MLDSFVMYFPIFEIVRWVPNDFPSSGEGAVGSISEYF